MPARVPVPTGVRLVATDLDGTLLGPDGSVGDRTRRAVAALAATGLELVIVTGRPPRWLAPVVARTGRRGTAIAANGAVVVDLADGRVTDCRPMAADRALAAVAALRGLDARVVFAVERARPGGVLAPTRGLAYADLEATRADPTEYALGVGYQPRWPVPPGTPVAPIEELVSDGDVVKLLARPGPGHDHDADSFLATADAALAGLVEVTHSNAHDVLLEMSAAGVSKASTLAAVAARRGVPAAAVVAVGDAPNDLPMLRWAGTAYAVANAHPALFDVADHVLPDHAHEGVAVLLESLVSAAQPTSAYPSS